jgi:hypothetical protein
MQAFAASVGARTQEAQEKWKMQHDAAWEQYQAALTAWQTKMNIVDQQADRIYKSEDLSDDQKAQAVQQLMAAVGPMPQRPTLPPFPTVQSWVAQNIFHRAPQAPAAPRPPALPAPAQPTPPSQSATPGGASAWRPWRAPSPIATATQPAAPPTQALPAQPGAGAMVMLPSGVPWWTPPKGGTMTIQQLHDKIVGNDPARERMWQADASIYVPYRNGVPDMTAPVTALISNMQRAGIGNPADTFSKIQTGVKLVKDPRTGKMVAVPINPATGDADFETEMRLGIIPSEESLTSSVGRYAHRVAGIRADDGLSATEKARRLATARQEFYDSLSASGMSREQIDARWQDVVEQAGELEPTLRSQQLMPIINPRTQKPMMTVDARGNPRPMMVSAAQAAVTNAELETQYARDQVQQAQFDREMRLRWTELTQRHDAELEAQAGRLQNNVVMAESLYNDAQQKLAGAESYLQSLYTFDPHTGQPVQRRDVDPREVARAKKDVATAAASLQRAWTRFRMTLQVYNGVLQKEGLPPMPDIPATPLVPPKEAPPTGGR